MCWGARLLLWCAAIAVLTSFVRLVSGWRIVIDVLGGSDGVAIISVCERGRQNKIEFVRLEL